MSYTLLTSNIGHNSVTVDTTGADLIVVILEFQASTSLNLTDNKSNTFTQRTKKEGGFVGGCIFDVQPPDNSHRGTSHTFSSTSAFNLITVLVFSGSAASAFDSAGQNGATTGGATTLATGASAPSEDNELIVTGGSIGNSLSNASVDSGFTKAQQAGSAGVYDQSGGWYLIQTGKASVNPVWSANTGSPEMAVVIASYKASAAASVASLIDGILIDDNLVDAALVQ